MTIDPNENRSMRDYAGIGLRGFAMGVCEIIPGVSGGTMAFILGIYEEMIDSIKGVSDPNVLKALTKFNIKELLRLLNWQFLISLVLGMGLAIISLAGLLGWILERYPVYLWSFFFGLVLASVLLVSKRVPRWTPKLYLMAVIGVIFAWVMVGLVPAETPDTWWFLILSGALAISAMILPGVSGSFVLVLLGKYETVLAAASVSHPDVKTLIFIAIGALIGLVTFAQVVSWLFKRYPSTTIATLIGLMLGSLRKLWPWKESLDFIESHSAPANIWPSMSVNGSFNFEVVLALLFAVLGIAAIILIERLGGEGNSGHKK